MIYTLYSFWSELTTTQKKSVKPKQLTWLGNIYYIQRDKHSIYRTLNQINQKKKNEKKDFVSKTNHMIVVVYYEIWF